MAAKQQTATECAAPARPSLPVHQALSLDGYTRWSVLKTIIPVSHETVRKREGQGRFPKRVQLGSARCVAWPNRELHRYLADPNGYRAEAA